MMVLKQLLMCLYISDIILKVRPLVDNELQHVRDEGTLISFLYPAQNQELIKKLSAKNVNAFGKIFKYFYCLLEIFNSLFIP